MSVLAQIAQALAYVHGCRVLHRDLKSQNVFLASSEAAGGFCSNGGAPQDCVAKLGDFGIARVLHTSEQWVQTCIGTPSHLPPEMCEGQPYDFKADVWGM